MGLILIINFISFLLCQVIDAITGDDYDSFNNTDSHLNDHEQFSRTDSIDIQGAVVTFYDTQETDIWPNCYLHIQTPIMQNTFVIGFDSPELAYEWHNAIQEATIIANQLDTERRKKERSARVAKEMSDLIIYFRSVPFREHSWSYHEMSSFSETKAEKQFLQLNTMLFLAYHRNQISRVYPKGQRIDSSNFNPIPFWNVGSQMIALNYQTGDKAMQLNQAKFRDNGQCGYLLKPKFMQNESFHPNNPLSINPMEECTISIHIIAGRHLYRCGKCSNPIVTVGIVGANFDTGIKHRTKSSNNGFTPIWNESCQFSIRNPYLAILRFEVQDEDTFSETHFVAQACYPLKCIRSGYRSVTLRNKYSEEHELAALLIHIEMKQVANTMMMMASNTTHSILNL